jgi:predicted restriction endonuclease
LAFPDYKDFPALFAQFVYIACISLFVALPFGLPEFFVCSGFNFTIPAIMHMPETAVEIMLACKSIRSENICHSDSFFTIERINMAARAEKWSRSELIMAFNLYCRIPFGRIHKSNPVIIDLARKISRTPSAVAMKMVNFASLDPMHQQRNVKGLQHGSKQDKAIWDEFHEHWEELAFESQQAISKISDIEEKLEREQFSFDPNIPTEAQRSVRVRLIQSFFRDTVLSSYNYSCAICRLNLRVLLNASHIIPWSADKSRRADPKNGLSLCVLHDRAFDRGLITVAEDFKVEVSEEVKIPRAPKLHRIGLLEIEGKKICLPDRFGPDPIAMAYHRNNIFLSRRSMNGTRNNP